MDRLRSSKLVDSHTRTLLAWIRLQLGKRRRSVADDVRSVAPSSVLVERGHLGTRRENVFAAKVVCHGAKEGNSDEDHAY